ncbi:putative transmembrane protein [Gregarina niphandrodes]|uniref:Transmembrane protein n=1 Tax=Gregarina niphandrodes TaxID=110365 RepID=A0A023B5W3_GRENI|nr:putative transmembrane protein [Gregarina niphandrodes]EZG62797.1 putative transmembrane protein [Gregarina niphandrodes]|eukprot:XP_011130718.1 putative transmembrane protein [Gregarina niphandrodes]
MRTCVHLRQPCVRVSLCAALLGVGPGLSVAVPVGGGKRRCLETCLKKDAVLPHSTKDAALGEFCSRLETATNPGVRLVLGFLLASVECEPVLVHPGEEEGLVAPKYLVWAYDVLRYGWEHLVPFDCLGSSVFGLARRAAVWKTCGKRNWSLEPHCYNVGVAKGTAAQWDVMRFVEWLASRRKDDVGCVAPYHPNHSLPKERVAEAIFDLLRGWRHFTADAPLARVIRGWWKTRSTLFQSRTPLPHFAAVSRSQFEGLFVTLLGNTHTPPEQIPAVIRKAFRKARINSTLAGLQPKPGLEPGTLASEPALTAGCGMVRWSEVARRCVGSSGVLSETVPAQLRSANGERFDIATTEEAAIRLPPPLLVWSYDVLFKGWWMAVPPLLRSRKGQLSLFGLAHAVAQMNGSNWIPSVAAACYACREGGVHSTIAGQCDRCDSPWSPDDFWNWLQLRHLLITRNPAPPQLDAERSTQNSRETSEGACHTQKVTGSETKNTLAAVERLLNEIGFEMPERIKGQERWPLPLRYQASQDSYAAHLQNWWATRVSEPPSRERGLTAWEGERLILINSLDPEALSPEDLVAETLA